MLCLAIMIQNAVVASNNRDSFSRRVHLLARCIKAVRDCDVVRLINYTVERALSSNAPPL